MKEIKFRAWDTANNEIYQVGTLVFEKPTGKLSEILDPIMQYTGLKDKNGKEIYEGDILEDTSPITGHESRDRQRKLGIAEWKQNEAAFILRWFNSRGSCTPLLYNMLDRYNKVIGNIYQDSHLLRITGGGI